MADRTSNTSFYATCIPGRIAFKSNASDGDSFILPFGVGKVVLGLQCEDDDDAIPSATVSGSTVTFNLVDDAGADIGTDTDICGEVLLGTQ